MSPEVLAAIRSSASIAEAAKKLGMCYATLHGQIRQARKAGDKSVPASRESHWRGLRDDDGSEWGKSAEPRCRCGLMLPCASCVPSLDEFATRHLADHRAEANPPRTEPFTVAEMARARNALSQFSASNFRRQSQKPEDLTPCMPVKSRG